MRHTRAFDSLADAGDVRREHAVVAQHVPLHQVHPQLPMRVARGREDYGARVKEHATLYARLVDVVGGPDGGFDINGADRFYWDFCSKVVNGCTLSMCKVATC